MQMLRNVDLVPVLPRVYAYGQILERHHGAMALAADVYETVIRLADLEFDRELVLDSYYRLAFCQRKTGSIVEAEAASRELLKLADRAKDHARALRGRMGLAQVAMLRGDYVSADGELQAVIEEAQRRDLTPELAAALHNQSVVASYRKDPRRASTLANRALRLTVDLAERDRILADLGAYLVAAGDYSAALDAFRILQVTASREEPRLAASGNIAITAARMGNRELFEQAVREVSIDRLGRDAQVAFMVEIAAGYRRFGEPTLADRWLGEAKRTAERYGLSPDVADEARVQPTEFGDNKERASDQTSDAALEVAATLRELATTLIR
jgi:tetratricopeptide (TPR) repeat protein